MPTKRSRTLWHLHYTDWGEHGCPTDTKAYLEFLEEVDSLRQHIMTTSSTSSSSPASSKSPKSSSYKNRNPPVLVHCSAGVGRTGVAILCDILLYCVDHNVDIDIPKILGHLRQQRMLMVQTVAQYKFVHMVLIQYLKQSRLIWKKSLFDECDILFVIIFFNQIWKKEKTFFFLSWSLFCNLQLFYVRCCEFVRETNTYWYTIELEKIERWIFNCCDLCFFPLEKKSTTDEGCAKKKRNFQQCAHFEIN